VHQRGSSLTLPITHNSRDNSPDNPLKSSFETEIFASAETETLAESVSAEGLMSTSIDIPEEITLDDLGGTISKRNRHWNGYESLGTTPRIASRFWPWGIAFLGLLLSLAYVLKPSKVMEYQTCSSCPRYAPHSTANNRMRWQDIYENTDLRPDSNPKIKWIPRKLDKHDGLYVDYNHGVFVMGHIRQGYPPPDDATILITNQALMIGPKHISDYFVSPTARYLLLVANPKSVFRNSYTADYYLCNIQHYFDEKTDKIWPSPEHCGKIPSPNVLDTGLGPRQSMEKQEEQLQNPTFSPNDVHLAYVHRNDLYLIKLEHGEETDALGTPAIRITTDGRTGAKSMFNGVPDWVYEEEVLESASTPMPTFLHDVNAAGGGTLKWSHSGKWLAFWKFDDEKVQVVNVPHLDFDERIAYPTPGTPNPHVFVEIYSLELKRVFEIQFPGTKDSWKDRIVWSTDWYPDTDVLLIRVTNRVQDVLSEYIVSWLDAKWVPKLVREIKYADGAWIDLGGPPNVGIQRLINSTHRLVLQLKEDVGRMHVALYDDVLLLKPRWLTRGRWDIQQLVHVNSTHIWYLSSESSSVESHLYLQRMDGWNQRVCLTCQAPWAALGNVALQNHEWILPGPTILPRNHSATAGSYQVSAFSGNGGFMIISNVGPTLPRSVAWSTDGLEPVVKVDLQSSERLRNILERGNWELPRRVWKTWTNAQGCELNVLELLPPSPSWNASAKYPTLIRVYGGPGSQLVSAGFELTRAHTVIASNPDLPMIVYVIDPRGTAGKGRSFRSRVSLRLGEDEAVDVIEFAKFLAEGGWNANVDGMRMSVWGWSFGGYLSLRILSKSATHPWPKENPVRFGVFVSTVSVAPVTDWMFYDSIYTERYMKLPTHSSTIRHGPDDNEEELKPTDSYSNSSLRELPKVLSTSQPLDKNQPFNLTLPKPRLLMMHGTADDNVHTRNSMVLFGEMLENLVDPTQVRLQVMPDSDHSMRAQEGKAQWLLYRLLHSWLLQSSFQNQCTMDELEEMISKSL
jgi:dipeptidyl aminopeptidase